MSGAILRRRDRTNRPLRVGHYRTAVNNWGMFETSTNARQAAEYAERDIGGMAFGSASYDWQNNEIEMYMPVTRYPYDTSHENCNKARRAFIGVLAANYGLEDESFARKHLRSRIDAWFSHHGYRIKGRDKELGEKLSHIMFVKVFLSNKSGNITCRERIMVFDAPSTPGATKNLPDDCDPDSIFYDLVKDLCE